jgi:inorganic phosphate transporter, PiT family
MAATETPASGANVATVRLSPLDANISAGPAAKIGMGIFGLVLLVGIIYIGRQLNGDLAEVHSPTIMPYVLLGLALLVALGFEFVNGFHDTANAVATVMCAGVSFFHGSNDVQKGMGLIMLILIGTVPTAYAVNHAVTYQQAADFIAVSTQAADALGHYISPAAVVGDSRDELTDYIRTKEFTPNTMLALRGVINGIGTEMAQYKQLKLVPQDKVRNFRNDMYVVSEALRLMKKTGVPKFSGEDAAILGNYKQHIDNATKFIPTWVKVAVALALGLGAMIGWKRIVVTVGEKIGKDHLTYAQGAAAEITAMATIGAADAFGLPVSTTHVLSSGVAGTMAANHSGLQWGTVRNLLMAWVLTLPASIMLAGFLFWAFRRMSGG